MNTQNTIRQIDNDLFYLSHSGVPGMSWHRHKFGRWQKQAVYANGQEDPDAKEKRNVAKDLANGAKNVAKNAATGVKNAVDSVRARADAKFDAAVSSSKKGGLRGLYTKGGQKIDKKSRDIGQRAGRMVGGTVGAVLDAALLPKAKSLKGQVGVLGATTAASLATSLAVNKAVRNAYKNRVNDTYKKHADKLKSGKVSKAYADAYKKNFDKYSKKYNKMSLNGRRLLLK